MPLPASSSLTRPVTTSDVTPSDYEVPVEATAIYNKLIHNARGLATPTLDGIESDYSVPADALSGNRKPKSIGLSNAARILPS